MAAERWGVAGGVGEGVDSGLVGFDFGKCVPWRRALLGREESG